MSYSYVIESWGQVSTANINVSNVSASVTVDSGASGTQPYASVAWLPNNFPLVVSTRDFDIEPLSPLSRPNVMIQVGPDTTRHVANPSAIQARRAYTRRRS